MPDQYQLLTMLWLVGLEVYLSWELCHAFAHTQSTYGLISIEKGRF